MNVLILDAVKWDKYSKAGELFTTLMVPDVVVIRIDKDRYRVMKNEFLDVLEGDNPGSVISSQQLMNILIRSKISGNDDYE